VRLQSSVARQIRSKKTPILYFAPDDVIRSAERIEKILRANPSPLQDAPTDASDAGGVAADVDAGTDQDDRERGLKGADGAA